jgi:hypothetical protein
MIIYIQLKYNLYYKIEFSDFFLDEGVLYRCPQDSSRKMLFSNARNAETSIESGLVKKKFGKLKYKNQGDCMVRHEHGASRSTH